MNEKCRSLAVCRSPREFEFEYFFPIHLHNIIDNNDVVDNDNEDIEREGFVILFILKGHTTTTRFAHF